MVKPGRRTLIVLMVLLGAMTIASGMLLGLEPGPRLPLHPLPLNVVDHGSDPEEQLYATTPPPEMGRWDTISIHFSGTANGSAQSLNQLHEKMGLKGLAYHMVVGNGQGSGDGEIEIGFRWKHQFKGISSTDTSTNMAGHNAIDICLIGDGNRQPPTEAQMRELVWLVKRLQARCNIPADQVLLYTDNNTGRGRMFPVAWFRQQLLNYSTP